ncbi:D-alanyl-D-alanine carboxypeptidase (penicillin-binding protein 5/6) [Novosphingobium kunmingense]|uniref:serine-type D-Ala-D-Ala carboxypeptidase n=1 Tax=Novosphingobium kunmingense TaxID=1211806 RepID=A0A2N0I2R3_9SPHN|nr:D-alanyl-D-alanine carboxypeptidase (penicillin-binding protein 5/6) [Novosphingobium kunmingense]
MPLRRFLPGTALLFRRLPVVLAALLPTLALAADRPTGHAAPLPRSVAQARVALLFDLSSERTLYARNEEARFLPASMAKAMTLLVAFDAIKAGSLREDALITVRPETARRWSGRGTTLFLQENERVAVRDLLAGVALISANDGAVALAEGMDGSLTRFSERMNARARNLGMADSHFTSPSGFPDGGATYVSAMDLVRLTRALVEDHPMLYRRYIAAPSMMWKGQLHASKSPFVGVVPGGDGVKTGHTYEAGFNFLGSAERGGRRLVVVVGGVWTAPGRAQSARDLLEWGYSEWDARSWLSPGTPVGHIAVQQGARRRVAVTVPRAYRLTVPRGARGRAEGTIVYSGPIAAPIAKGARVGELRVSVDGALPYALPLVAAETVERAGPFDRTVNGLLGLWR